MANTQKYLDDLKEIKSKSTWLQGVGAHAGKPAGDVVPGDVFVWNGGSTSTVIRQLSETPKTITFETMADGKTYQRKLKKTRIVAIEGMGIYNVTKDEIS